MKPTLLKNSPRVVALLAVTVMSLLLSNLPARAQTAFNAAAIQQQLAALEKSSGGRLGVALIDTADNSHILYRGDERFALCSTSKVMAVAALLKQSETDNTLLQQQLPIRKADMVNYNPITQRHIGASMT